MLEYTVYYGLDWIAMVITFFAIMHIGNKNKFGFMLMMSGNTTWIFVGLLADSMAMILANIIFFSMNLRAIVKWSKDVHSHKLNMDKRQDSLSFFHNEP